MGIFNHNVYIRRLGFRVVSQLARTILIPNANARLKLHISTTYGCVRCLVLDPGGDAPECHGIGRVRSRAGVALRRVRVFACPCPGSLALLDILMSLAIK